MARKFVDKKKSTSIIKDNLENKRKVSVGNMEISGNFKVSFAHVDKTQKFGSGYLDWQKHGLLAKMFETLQGYCCSPLLDQIDGNKFAKYGDFPASKFNEFNYPDHVPEDACWARIHITGPAVLAGHIVRDTFYVVFLDKTHKFYKTRRARGE